MALKRGIVKLDEYTNDWEKEYLKEEKLLKSLLKDKIIETHHIGSTSIPGLKAKPIIDILIVLKDFDCIDDITNILEHYGYENRGKQGIDDRFFFAKGPDDARTHYIHFTLPNSDTYYNQIYFKKYLIEHPEYIQKYCDLKEKLAKQYANDRPKYTKGKDEFIKSVIAKANQEYDT